MKSLKLLLFIAGILLAQCTGAFAQRAENTGSAKAYYGNTPGKPKYKKQKKQKVDWAIHSKPAKGTRADAWSTRRKYARA